MKKIYIIIVIGLLLIINLSALATLGYHRFVAGKADNPVCCQSGEDYLCQELALSSSQIEQMKAIKASFQARAEGISRQLFPKRAELVSQLKTVAPDSQQIRQLLQEISVLQTELQQQVIQSVLKQKAILNSGQQNRFFALISQRLIYESRCQQASGLNPLENNCNSISK
jgi:Spy/CpxP family protein refolding chaperone